MNELCAVIFSTQNFMPRTKVCIESLEKFHPEIRIDLNVVVDDTQPGEYVPNLAKKRLERILKNLELGFDVLMLGADCVLYDRIDDFLHEREEYSAVLVPHVCHPTNDNAKYYRTGHANGDVVLFSGQEAVAMVKWMLSQPLENAPSEGKFYEQALLSSLPFMFSGVSINRNPRINIAYFNVQEDIRWFIHPALIQYSGFIEGEHDKLSKYYSGPAVKDPVLLEYYREYDKAVRRNKT